MVLPIAEQINQYQYVQSNKRRDVRAQCRSNQAKNKMSYRRDILAAYYRFLTVVLREMIGKFHVASRSGQETQGLKYLQRRS